MPGLHFRSMTTTGVMPVLGTGRTVGSPVAVCWTPVSVMIAPVLRLSGRDTASTPGKVYHSNIEDIIQHILQVWLDQPLRGDGCGDLG